MKYCTKCGYGDDMDDVINSYLIAGISLLLHRRCARQIARRIEELFGLQVGSISIEWSTR